MGTVRYGIILLIGVLLLATLTPLSAQTEITEIQLNDRFERDMTARGLTIVDWEGYISNPAIQYTLIPPVDVTYPLTVELSANHPRLMFDNPVFFDETGPRKTLYFESATPKNFYISIWHDDDGDAESYQLDVNLIDANGAVTLIQSIPIEVIDQDQPERPIEFEITYQFIDQDEGFFDNSETGELRQEIVRRATSDWAYFFSRSRI